MNKNQVKGKTKNLFSDEGRRIVLLITVAFAIMAVVVGAILQSVLWIFAALMILGFGIILDFVTIAAKKMTKLEAERKVRDDEASV